MSRSHIFGFAIYRRDDDIAKLSRHDGYRLQIYTKMKPDALFRSVPANIHELLLALAGLPTDMKVKADPETGVFEKTVDELRARTIWPPGLVLTTPRKLHAKSVVKISKAI